MSQGGDLNERTVYVRDLDERVTEPLLHELFIQVGPVESVTIRGEGSTPTRNSAGGSATEQTPPTGGSAGGGGGGRTSTGPRFAFVSFADEDSVLFACEMLDLTPLYGRRIRVKPRERTTQFAVYQQLGIERLVATEYLDGGDSPRHQYQQQRSQERQVNQHHQNQRQQQQVVGQGQMIAGANHLLPLPPVRLPTVYIGAGGGGVPMSHQYSLQQQPYNQYQRQSPQINSDYRRPSNNNRQPQGQYQQQQQYHQGLGQGGQASRSAPRRF